ncbi:MAG: GAF domain-containing sensor histidine kinase [Cyanobacteriota bacterium]|nr:GAF domain-containing sensor histidine kinase [Cyanobacteriota bacterium]
MQPSVDSAQVGQQITQLLSESVQMEIVPSQVAKILSQVFPNTECSLAIWDGDRFCSDAVSWVEPSPTSSDSTSLDLWQDAKLMRRLKNSNILSISNIERGTKVSGVLASQCKALGIQSILVATTRFQGKLNGAIAMVRSQTHCWSVAEEELLKSISVSVASAISHVLQARALISLQRRTRAFYHQQTLMARLTKAIQNSLDLTQILQEAVEGITQTLEVNHGLVILVKHTTAKFPDRPSFALSTGESERGEDKDREHSSVPDARITVVGQWLVNEEGQTVAVDSTPESPRSSQAIHFKQSFMMSECVWCQEAFRRAPLPLAISGKEVLAENLDGAIAPIFQPQKMPAVLLVPLISPSENAKGSILGFLVLQNDRPRSWKPEELELVKLVGNQLSNALIQARTLHKVHTIVGDRTDQLKRSMDVQAKLYEQTRRQIEQLRTLNQQKDEFLSTISHELKTPLTSMTLAIRMLRQSDIDPERQAKYLDILEEQCLQETNLVNDLLMFQRLEAKQVDLKLNSIDLVELISELGDRFEPRWQKKDLEFSAKFLQPSLMLQSDADSLRRILEELLTNASKYSNAGTTVCCTTVEEKSTSGDRVAISVTNLAPEISQEDLNHLFDKFRRGPDATQQAVAGTGLGLALVKSLAQFLHGTIEVSSQPTQEPNTCEICFTLTLPLCLDSSLLGDT